eukprot:15470360-Alexandrium_andersonii.AAC.1
MMIAGMVLHHCCHRPFMLMMASNMASPIRAQFALSRFAPCVIVSELRGWVGGGDDDDGYGEHA